MMAAVALGRLCRTCAHCADAWVAPFLDELASRIPQLSGLYDELFPAYRGHPQGHAPPASGTAQTGVRRLSEDHARQRRSPSWATASCCRPCSSRRSARRAATRSRSARWRALAGRADGARLCRAGHGGAEGISWATPDEIVRISSATPRSFVTHLAPFSGGMLERLPKLKLDRRLARRSGEHRHGRRARARRSGWSTRPAATPAAVAEFTIGAILAETRLITKRA